MGKALRAILFGVIGAIVLAVATLLAGFGLASVFDRSGQHGLGMLVPLVFMPLAFLIGLVCGGWYGWKRG